MLAQHNLIAAGWKVRWARKIGDGTTAGNTSYRDQTITLSPQAVQKFSDRDVVALVLHEIGHALVGPGHGHERVWKKQVRAIGGKPVENCPDFVSGIGSAENIWFLILVLAGIWFVLPPLGLSLSIAAGIGFVVSSVVRALPVLSAREIAKIENAVLNP
jgi:hypothetical protein